MRKTLPMFFISVAICALCTCAGDEFIVKGQSINFSAANFSGRYTFACDGVWDVGGNGSNFPYREVGVVIADGKGNWTYQHSVQIIGNPSASGSNVIEHFIQNLAGKYNVNTDGTGFLTFSETGDTGFLTVSADGSHVRLVSNEGQNFVFKCDYVKE